MRVRSRSQPRRGSDGVETVVGGIWKYDKFVEGVNLLKTVFWWGFDLRRETSRSRILVSRNRRRRLLFVEKFAYNMYMGAQENNSLSIRGLKKYTASTVADRMAYWMTKSIFELSEKEADDTLSALDLICIRSLLSDYKYAKLKNMDVMLSRIVGTPVSQMNINKTVNSDKPVQIELVGVDVKDENSLQALEDLRTTEESGESES